MAMLTSGAITEMLNKNKILRPLLQVLRITASGHAQNYRIVLSDGDHKTSVFLASCLNSLVVDGYLVPYDVVILNRYVCKSIKQVLVLDLLVANRDGLQSHTLGLPVNVTMVTTSESFRKSRLLKRRMIANGREPNGMYVKSEETYASPNPYEQNTNGTTSSRDDEWIFKIEPNSIKIENLNPQEQYQYGSTPIPHAERALKNEPEELNSHEQYHQESNITVTSPASSVSDLFECTTVTQQNIEMDENEQDQYTQAPGSDELTCQLESSTYLPESMATQLYSHDTIATQSHSHSTLSIQTYLRNTIETQTDFENIIQTQTYPRQDTTTCTYSQDGTVSQPYGQSTCTDKHQGFPHVTQRLTKSLGDQMNIGNLHTSRHGENNHPELDLCRINQLNPNSPWRWTIVARVTRQTNVRHWQYQGEPGHSFSVVLQDDSGEIEATAFGEQSDDFLKIFVQNEVYYISNGQVKLANPRFNRASSEYQIYFNHQTVISRCSEVERLPFPRTTSNSNFQTLSSLQTRKPGDKVDVIGIVKSVKACIKGCTKDKKDYTKREIFLVDESKIQCSLTIWNRESLNFEDFEHPVVLAKRCIVVSWDGGSLNTQSSSEVCINPDIPETARLQQWFNVTGCEMEFREYTLPGSQKWASLRRNNTQP